MMKNNILDIFAIWTLTLRLMVKELAIGQQWEETHCISY